MVKAKVPVEQNTRIHVGGGSVPRFLGADCDEWFAALDALRRQPLFGNKGRNQPVTPRRVVFKLK